MTDSKDFLTLAREGYVATVTLNRPEQHNAWHPQMGLDLEAIVRTLGSDAAVRVIVITGAGKSFCAGLDLGYLRDVRAGRRHAQQRLDRLNQRGHSSQSP